MEETLVVWSYYDFMRGQRDPLASGGSLFYIILATAYKATDPRDSVFGLLGIVSSSKVVPDYSQPVENIYTEWFTTVLKDWEDFQPLYFSGITNAPHSHEMLPSGYQTYGQGDRIVQCGMLLLLAQSRSLISLRVSHSASTHFKDSHTYPKREYVT